jgi:F-type H+-transporting ATPase subunit gamma
MKTVSAAKLRRAQDRVIAARPYAKLLSEMLANLVAATTADERTASNPLLAQRPEKRIQMILITSDKGLAGAFNSNLIKAATKFAQEHPDAEIQMTLIGRKGRDYFRKRGANIAGEYVNLLGNPQYADARSIAGEVIKRFRDAETDAVYLLNNEFKSVVSQKLTVTRLLPVIVPAAQPGPDYIYEQPPAEMLERMLPRFVEIEIYRAMMETAAAEHAARLMAMEAASSNAADMIDRLLLHMNRVRQASITKEIIEVVSGAAAAE